jgi:hypothetical protein
MPKWQEFAVEIKYLTSVGLRANDLRSLRISIYVEERLCVPTHERVDVAANYSSPWQPGRAHKWERALVQLLEADYYARDLKLPAADFAVELRRLAEAGLTANDLRWLCAKGFIEQAVRAVRPGARRKQSFRDAATISAPSRSGVVITALGLAFARQVCRERSEEEGPALVAADSQESLPDVLPRWDPGCRALWLGPTLVKQYKVPALNQEIILSAFSEEGWPTFIDDPLPPIAGVDAKHRLHDTIARLNRAQKYRLIRFHGNGNGLAVHWERLVTDNRSTTDCP